MSSRTPTTPAAKSLKTPSASSRKRRHMSDDDEETSGSPVGVRAGSSDGDSSPPVEICRRTLKETFGEDRTWYGSHYFASILAPKGRKLAASQVYLWLVFATAFDHNLQFGPKNVYNARNAQLVADFVVEQWGVRPDQITHFPSGGRTLRYLLSFNEVDLLRVISKLPHGWTKLTRGLGCRVISPTDSYCSPFAVTVTGVPSCIDVARVKHALIKFPFVRAFTDAQRVILDNNVKTDRVEAWLELEDGVTAPLSMSSKDFSFEFSINDFGLTLSRRQLCTTCGDDGHRHADCPVKHKLTSSSVRGWSFVATESDSDHAKDPENVVVPSTSTTVVAPGIAEVAVPLESDGKVEARKKKPGKRKKEESDRPAKRAKV